MVSFIQRTWFASSQTTTTPHFTTQLLMLASRLSSTIFRTTVPTTRQALRTTTPLLRPFHSTSSIMADFPEGHKDQSSPPPHQLVYFKGLTKNVREFGVFRKVLHTSMYSQLVAMEIPVGGDIGVCISNLANESTYSTSSLGRGTHGRPSTHLHFRRRRGRCSRPQAKDLRQRCCCGSGGYAAPVLQHG